MTRTIRFISLISMLVLSACTINVSAAPTAAPTTAAQPTAAPQQPTAAPAATSAPAATAVPGSGTAVPQPVPTSASNPQGTVYMISFTEAQINNQMNTAIASTKTDIVSSATVSLQNGTITKRTTHTAPGPGGKTIDGVIAVAVSTNNCDLIVAVTQATVGQANMPDAQKNAISAAYQKALSSALAQARDYKCVDSVRIAGGVMTVFYH